MIAQLYRRLKGSNHVPSRYDAWEDGERTKNIPIERVIGGPSFRDSSSDHLLQMADLIAHALLKQEEEPSHGWSARVSLRLSASSTRHSPQGFKS